jgi:tetratricopeptide (TPR) repeat protein
MDIKKRFMNKLLLIFLLISAVSFAQPDSVRRDKKNTNIFTDAGDAAKMVLAKQKLYAKDYIGAVNLYREVEKNSPQDATVLYHIGYCYLELKDLNKAKDYLLRAEQSTDNFKPEVHVALGRVYQLEHEFDKAVEQFEKYKTLATTDKQSNDEAELRRSQSLNAKALMMTPLDVLVSNMGPDINSKYDDKNPCMTADGSKLVFTTRRPRGTDAPVDAEGDGKYFEDIYISTRDSASRFFGKAVEVAGAINTKAHDACTSISADGKQIFLYKNDLRDKKSRGGEVFVSKVAGGKWKTPEPLGKPISSSYWEGGACISPDGKNYFFTSERPGGHGGSDIWMVEKISKKEWGKPVNLGPEINSVYDEAGMFLAPDGKTLFFCSNGPKSMGDYDVFKSVYANGKWGAAVNVGYPINSPAKEGQLTLSADAKFAYISSERKGSLGESDIYAIDLKDHAILETDGQKKSASTLSILKGTIREGNEGFGLVDVSIIVSDDQGVQVSTTMTDELGEYFLTLKGGNYILTVRKKGYKDITENIEMKVGDKETFSLEKGYLLKK